MFTYNKSPDDLSPPPPDPNDFVSISPNCHRPDVPVMVNWGEVRVSKTSYLSICPKMQNVSVLFHAGREKWNSEKPIRRPSALVYDVCYQIYVPNVLY